MTRKGFIVVILMCNLLFQSNLTVPVEAKGEVPAANDDCRKIRSGLTGTIGYSKLYLDDAIRPFYTTSQYYPLKPDLFLTVGAVIMFHPKFMSQGWLFRFDPAFTKFSYGSHHEITYQNITSSIDIDIETIKIPFSLEYEFLPLSKHFHPFLRGGLSTSYAITYSADFYSVINTDGNQEVLTDNKFNFSKFQNTVFLSGGVDLVLWNWDFTAELVVEKGDGIYKDKFGDAFLKKSNTTNYYLQLGILF